MQRGKPVRYSKRLHLIIHFREKEAREHFDELLKKMKDVYSSWSVKSMDEVLDFLHIIYSRYDRSQDSVIISRQALERWLSKPLAKPKTKPKGTEESETTLEILPTSDILCQHDALDPQRASNMKRVSAVSPLSNLLRSTKSKILERL